MTAIHRESVKTDIFFAIAQRCLVLTALFLISSASFNLMTFPGLRDGGGYLNLAKGFLQGTFIHVPPEDSQYFIGYPFFLSFFLRFLPPWAAVYLFQFSCLAGSLYLGRRLFNTPWITRWLTLCIPSYVLFTSMNMTESFIIFLVFAAVYAYEQKKMEACALVFACALVTRPQSICFLYLLILADLIKNRNFSNLLTVIFLPALCLALMHFFNDKVFGDFLHNYRLYGAHDPSRSFLSIPFSGYLNYSQDTSIRLVNRLYIWIFTGFTFLGILLFWVRSLRDKLPFVEKLFLHWGTIQFFFFLSLNSRWGFMELPRYFILVLPTALLGYYEKIPKTWGWVIAAGIFSIVFSVYAEGSGNRYAY